MVCLVVAEGPQSTLLHIWTVGISVILKLHDKILRYFRLGQSCPRLQFRTMDLARFVGLRAAISVYFFLSSFSLSESSFHFLVFIRC